MSKRSPKARALQPFRRDLDPRSTYRAIPSARQPRACGLEMACGAKGGRRAAPVRRGQSGLLTCQRTSARDGVARRIGGAAAVATRPGLASDRHGICGAGVVSRRWELIRRTRRHHSRTIHRDAVLPRGQIVYRSASRHGGTHRAADAGEWSDASAGLADIVLCAEVSVVARRSVSRSRTRDRRARPCPGIADVAGFAGNRPSDLHPQRCG